MLLNNTNANVIAAPVKGGNPGEILPILPGVNILTAKQWESVKGTLGDREDVVKVVKVEKAKDGKETEKAVELQDLEPSQASKLIPKITSVDVVNKWLDVEVRDAVRLELVKRRDAIQSELNKTK